MADWQAFQADVLDTFRQYRGFMDFYEQVSDLGGARPDCFVRTDREDKKELWIVDAKNKRELKSGDLQRMQKYVEAVRAEPVNVGLEPSDLEDYALRTVFVAPEKLGCEEHESVPAPRLHQFLQRELVFTDTEKAVRKLSQMVRKRELGHSHARMLYRSLRPYIDTLETSMASLRDLEENYVGLELLEPPISSFDTKLPVDAVLKHRFRDVSFLIDVPYSRKSVESLENRAEELSALLSGTDGEVYYAAIDRFGGSDSSFTHEPGRLEPEVADTAGILPVEKVAEWFRPKTKMERTVERGALKFSGEEMSLLVSTRDDVNFRVEALLPERAASAVREVQQNSRTSLGELDSGRFRMELEISRDGKIDHGAGEQDPAGFGSTVRSLFREPISREVASRASATDK